MTGNTRLISSTRYRESSPTYLYAEFHVLVIAYLSAATDVRDAGQRPGLPGLFQPGLIPNGGWTCLVSPPSLGRTVTPLTSRDAALHFTCPITSAYWAHTQDTCKMTDDSPRR